MDVSTYYYFIRPWSQRVKWSGFVHGMCITIFIRRGNAATRTAGVLADASFLCYYHPDVANLPAKKKKKGTDTRVPQTATIAGRAEDASAAADEKKEPPRALTHTNAHHPSA